jgi:hypothetical protein
MARHHKSANAGQVSPAEDRIPVRDGGVKGASHDIDPLFRQAGIEIDE